MRTGKTIGLIATIVILSLILCACVLLLLHSHDFQTQVLVQPRCDAEGILKTSCTKCWVTSETPIPKLEHTYGETVLGQAATCKEEGKMVARCTVCGAEDVMQVLPKTQAHVFVNTMLRDSTCSDGGEGIDTCVVCGLERSCTYPLKEHTYGDPVVTLQATCSECGIEEIRCSACPQVITNELPMLAHTWGSAPCDQPAACQSCGTKDTKPSGHNYQLKEHYPSSDPGMAGIKKYICRKCGDDHVEYYGRYGTFDLEAIQSEANNYAASLGFHINEAVVDHEYVKVSRDVFYFVNLDAPGIHADIQGKLNYLVRYTYENAVQNHPTKGPAGYYLWAEVTYSQHSMIGYIEVRVSTAFTE